MAAMARGTAQAGGDSRARSTRAPHLRGALLLLIAVASLSGCAATPYQPADWHGGYEDVRIAPDQFLIEVRGNGFTTELTLIGHFHRRADELCRAAGFAHYRFERESRAESTQQPSTITVNTTQTASGTQTSINEHRGLTVTRYAVRGLAHCTQQEIR